MYEQRSMQIDEITRPSVGADYGFEANTPDTRRCRFIAHTADLSAFAGSSTIPLNFLNFIIGLCRLFQYPA